MLDTSTVILRGRIDDPADLLDEVVISVITLAELSVGRMSPVPTKSARHARRICSRRSRTSTCWCSMPSLRAHLGQLRASLRASGRKPAARAYDALIAASAIAYDLPLYSCNPSDFDAIPRLDLRTVPHPDRGKP